MHGLIAQREMSEFSWPHLESLSFSYWPEGSHFPGMRVRDFIGHVFVYGDLNWRPMILEDLVFFWMGKDWFQQITYKTITLSELLCC